MRWLIFILLLSGCASRFPQSDELLKDHGSLPLNAKAEVPFVEQKQNLCGPSALTMLLAHREIYESQAALEAELMTPEGLGTYQADLIGAVRRRGLLGIQVRDMRQLLEEISLNNPVIVFQNLGLEAAPIWHFAVAFAYDLKKQTITLHSGKVEHLEQDLRLFEKTWKSGDYWGTTILKPGQLSAGNEIDHIRATAGLEELGFLEKAETSYRSILSRFPNSLTAFIGLANVAYARHDLKTSIAYLQRATIGHPESPMAWHNLAVAYGESGKKTLARKSAERALKLTSINDRSAFEESLSTWISQTANNTLQP